MKLWILKPLEGLDPNPWSPWYDKAFGHIVRAETEEEARLLADHENGDETGQYSGNKWAWIKSELSSCEELTADGDAESIMVDFRAA